MWGRGGTCPPLGAGGWLGTELVPIVPHVGPRAPRAPMGGPTGVGSGVSSGPSALREQVSSSSQAVAVAWAQPGLSAPPTQITLWGAVLGAAGGRAASLAPPTQCQEHSPS